MGITSASATDDLRLSQEVKEPRYRRAAQAALVAAVLAMGLYGGYQFAPAQDGASPVVYEGGRLVASGELESVLYNPRYETGEDGPTAGVELRNRQNETCRSFADRKVKGVACQRGGDWGIAELRQLEIPFNDQPLSQ